MFRIPSQTDQVQLKQLSNHLLHYYTNKYLGDFLKIFSEAADKYVAV